MNHGLKTDEKTTKKKINDLQKRIHNCNKVIEYILNTKEWLLFDKIDSKEQLNQKVDIYGINRAELMKNMQLSKLRDMIIKKMKDFQHVVDDNVHAIEELNKIRDSEIVREYCVLVENHHDLKSKLSNLKKNKNDYKLIAKERIRDILTDLDKIEKAIKGYSTAVKELKQEIAKREEI